MMPAFDPSKMDPKLLMELTELVRQLPPHQIQKMQSLMHNMMAGFDVRKEMEEFEATLPPGFREKLVVLMAAAGPMPESPIGDMKIAGLAPDSGLTRPTGTDAAMDLREARLTLLRGVAEGRLTPEEAEKLLFP